MIRWENVDNVIEYAKSLEDNPLGFKRTEYRDLVDYMGRIISIFVLAMVFIVGLLGYAIKPPVQPPSHAKETGSPKLITHEEESEAQEEIMPFFYPMK